MPDPNTEHGLRVQLATALRERDEARKACAEMKRERDDYKEAHRHAHETITVVFENRVKKAEEALSAEKARADAGHEAMLSEARLHATHYARADAAEAALAAARRECEELKRVTGALIEKIYSVVRGPAIVDEVGRICRAALAAPAAGEEENR